MLDDRQSHAPRRRGEKTTAATLVYQRVRQDILRGELKPGQKLRIDAVSSRYGVGTNPVREALNRLSSERLVDRQDQRGFFVPPISIERLRELVKTRCWLESKALEESILNRDQAWEDRLVLACHRLWRTRWALPDGSLEGNPEWEEHHRAFHRALIAACGSSWLIGFCDDLMAQAERYRHIAMSSVYPTRIGNDEHRGIMEAALDGDIPRAQQRLTEHYQLTLSIIESQAGT
jgi:GntR family transcriptional regulator, carbon starvation induced regulator